MKRLKRRSQSERLAEQTAKANQFRRELAGSVGSPYRIQEAIGNKGVPIPNKTPGRKGE